MRYGMLAALFTTVLVLSTTGRAAAQQAMPDLRGTWKGQSESVVRSGGGNTHHRNCLSDTHYLFILPGLADRYPPTD